MGCQEKLVAKATDAKGVRLQYAALCWRMGQAGVEILLITSRDTGRWVIPKGWPMAGLAPEQAAAREAWEEAGVRGQSNPICLGRFGYHKALSPSAQVPCAVAVYGLQVDSMARKFPERAERRREWFPADQAAALVREPDLARLIASFSPPPSAGRAEPISG